MNINAVTKKRMKSYLRLFSRYVQIANDMRRAAPTKAEAEYWTETIRNINRDYVRRKGETKEALRSLAKVPTWGTVLNFRSRLFHLLGIRM